jgi:arabinose-5-phosphate isomerase
MDNIKSLLRLQRVECDKFYNDIDPLMIKSTVDIFMRCKGDIYFSGLGKNETIINHLISLLKSVSIKTNYLSPTNCLHGDIGIINKNDTIFFVSKSGNTQELLDIIPYIKKRTQNLYGIFCNKTSKIGLHCKDVIYLPCGNELGDKFNLIPTTSIVSFVTFANVLVLSLVGKYKLLLTDYGNNHPSGSIGRKISLTAEDIMICDNRLPLVFCDTKVLDALLMMTSKMLGLVLIIDNETRKMLGIITDGDIRRQLMHNNNDILKSNVQDIMNTNPIIFNKNDKLDYILKTIHINKSLLSGVPIVDDNNNLCGLITHTELF